MKKQEILDEIRRTSAENGGQPLGRGSFSTTTGIKKSAWYGKYWAQWGDALKEAGFGPNRLTPRISDSEMLDALAGFTRELGKIPGEGELRLRTRRGDGFPHATTIRKLGNRRAIAAKLISHLTAKTGFDDVVSICQGFIEATPDAAVSPASESTALDGGFVYLLRSGNRYKIGATADLARRSQAIAIQMPDPTSTVHVIRTDDAFGIEAYWHRRFAAKRTNGEWFNLDRADVAVFKRRKTM
jgi:T5orf172 domain.